MKKTIYIISSLLLLVMMIGCSRRNAQPPLVEQPTLAVYDETVTATDPLNDKDIDEDIIEEEPVLPEEDEESAFAEVPQADLAAKIIGTWSDEFRFRLSPVDTFYADGTGVRTQTAFSEEDGVAFKWEIEENHLIMTFNPGPYETIFTALLVIEEDVMSLYHFIPDLETNDLEIEDTPTMWYRVTGPRPLLSHPIIGEWELIRVEELLDGNWEAVEALQCTNQTFTPEGLILTDCDDSYNVGQVSEWYYTDNEIWMIWGFHLSYYTYELEDDLLVLTRSHGQMGDDSWRDRFTFQRVQ